MFKSGCPAGGSLQTHCSLQPLASASSLNIQPQPPASAYSLNIQPPASSLNIQPLASAYTLSLQPLASASSRQSGFTGEVSQDVGRMWAASK